MAVNRKNYYWKTTEKYGIFDVERKLRFSPIERIGTTVFRYFGEQMKRIPISKCQFLIWFVILWCILFIFQSLLKCWNSILIRTFFPDNRKMLAENAYRIRPFSDITKKKICSHRRHLIKSSMNVKFIRIWYSRYSTRLCHPQKHGFC